MKYLVVLSKYQLSNSTFMFPFCIYCFFIMTTSHQQAFSVFFVCVAFTSDIICLLFIPVQWLFFAASTYVWVQYVWHTGMVLLVNYLDIWKISHKRKEQNQELTWLMFRKKAHAVKKGPRIIYGCDLCVYIKYFFTHKKRKERTNFVNLQNLQNTFKNKL